MLYVASIEHKFGPNTIASSISFATTFQVFRRRSALAVSSLSNWHRVEVFEVHGG
jgi:hypothetical protein